MSLREQPVLNQIMIDLETLDVCPTAVVLSIGAVRFNEKKIGDTFYAVLDTDDQQLAGRTVSPKTLEWWAQQSAEARKVFDTPGMSTRSALEAFSQWLGDGNLQIWGNGADFDNIIWGSLYDAFKMKRPWSYSNNRCYRTIKNVLGTKVPLPPREGTHHNALDDAVHQARCTQLYLAGVPIWVTR